MRINNRIDFAIIISVNDANPNGDPVNGNRPRQTYDGYGEISDVCLKRKIRNRFFAMGHDILIRIPEQQNDGFSSTANRIKKTIGDAPVKPKDNYASFVQDATQKWIDVRAFGQVFPIKGEGSIPIRGPVSVQSAKSLDVIDPVEVIITKSENYNDAPGASQKARDTMGSRHKTSGIYVTYGGIYPQLAEKTNFSYEDAMVLKEVMRSLFLGDESAARPAGSMRVEKLFWWEHASFNGNCSPLTVHRSLNVQSQSDFPYYNFSVNQLANVSLEIIEGW